MNCLKQLLSEKEVSDYVPDHAVKSTEWIARFIISWNNNFDEFLNLVRWVLMTINYHSELVGLFFGICKKIP